MTKLIPTWVWAAIIAALLAVIGIQYAANQVTVSGKNTHIAQIEKNLADQLLETQKLRTDQEKDKAAREKAARQQEQTAQAQAEQARKTTNEQIARLSSDLARAKRMLRDAAQQARAAAGPAGELPAPAGPGSSGDPAGELPRQDGDDHLDFAASAELVRIGLKACYAAYDRAQEMINGPARKN